LQPLLPCCPLSCEPCPEQISRKSATRSTRSPASQKRDRNRFARSAWTRPPSQQITYARLYVATRAWRLLTVERFFMRGVHSQFPTMGLGAANTSLPVSTCLSLFFRKRSRKWRLVKGFTGSGDSGVLGFTQFLEQTLVKFVFDFRVGFLSCDIVYLMWINP
jgi:hypothetical protein